MLAPYLQNASGGDVEPDQPALLSPGRSHNTGRDRRTAAPHHHPPFTAAPYLPCWCVWCCWPPSVSPGVSYASPGDRTPCVAADCDGEDLRKSRSAVLLRRPSFFRLAVGCSRLRLRVNGFFSLFFLPPLSLALSFYAALNSAESLGAKRREWLFGIQELRRFRSAFLRAVHRAYTRDAAQGHGKRGWGGRWRGSERRGRRW